MKTQSKTDWERVKREAKANLPITVDRSSDPYDPNDEEAVSEYWKNAVIRLRDSEGREFATPGPASSSQIDSHF